MNKENDEIKKIIEDLKLKNVSSNPDEKSKATILTKYELECMLPDYVFDKLTDAEKAKFEGAIVNFPELEQEVADTQAVFADIEQFDYKALIKDKSQYLPARVADNLEQQGKLYKEWQPNKKRLVGFGVLSVALFAILYFNRSYFEVDENITTAPPVTVENAEIIFTDLEKELLADEIAEDDFVEMLEYIPGYAEAIDNDLYSLFADVDANFYDMIYSDFENYSEINSVMSSAPDHDYYMLLNWVDDADESIFQDLLDDMHDS